MARATVSPNQIDDVVAEARRALAPVRELDEKWDLAPVVARLEKTDPRKRVLQLARNAAHLARQAEETS